MEEITFPIIADFSAFAFLFQLVLFSFCLLVWNPLDGAKEHYIYVAYVIPLSRWGQVILIFPQININKKLNRIDCNVQG
jgi:hypothetical protein